MHIAPWARFSRFAQTSTLATVMALALSGLAGCGSNGHDGGATRLPILEMGQGVLHRVVGVRRAGRAERIRRRTDAPDRASGIAGAGARSAGEPRRARSGRD